MPASAPLSERTIRILGERCRELRQQRGLSREALSELSRGSDALSIATIKRAELGQPIYPASAAALARTLDVPLSELLVAPSTDKLGARKSGSGQAAIAVLPFRTLTDGAEARLFADGVAADIIHRLGAFWFPVIARGSSFRVASSAASPPEIGEQLGADYLVEGSVRVLDGRIRLIAALVRASDGCQVWSEAYEAQYSDVLALQATLARDIGSQIGAAMLAVEGSRYARCDPTVLDAWSLGLRSAWHLHRSTLQDNREARLCAQRAIELDPIFALPHYVITISHQHDLLNQWTTDPNGTLRQLTAASLVFERHCPNDPMMYVATAYADVARGHREDARSRLEAALELDPNSMRAHSLYGQVLAMAGRADHAIHELELARTLSPRDPAMWTISGATALAHFVAERYEDAVQWAKRAVRDRPQVPFMHAVVAASCALGGDLSEARRALVALREREAMLSEDGVLAIMRSTEPSIAERFLAGLRGAGLSGRH